MKRISPSTKLREAAQLQIQQLFATALSETGETLPSAVRNGIAQIIDGPHKTFRYMLLTGLLVAVTDPKLHPRCLQVNAGIEGAYDARSLCQKVIVPFEKQLLQGRLGASNEPFANKSARFAMIELSNNVRKGIDTILLNALYTTLEIVRLGDAELRGERIVFPKQEKTLISARSVLQTFGPPGTDGNEGVCEAKITIAKSPVLRASPYAGMIFNGMGRPIDLDRPCQTLPASMGGNKTPIIDMRLLADPSAENWLEAVHAKIMRGSDLSRTKVPAFIRRITVSEASALQGFPRDFVFCGSQCERYRQIGNSVPPPFAEHVARAVLKAMSRS